MPQRSKMAIPMLLLGRLNLTYDKLRSGSRAFVSVFGSDSGIGHRIFSPWPQIRIEAPDMMPEPRQVKILTVIGCQPRPAIRLSAAARASAVTVAPDSMRAISSRRSSPSSSATPVVTCSPFCDFCTFR